MNSPVLFLVCLLFPSLIYAQEKMEPGMAVEKVYQQHIPLIQDIAMGGFYHDPPLKIKGHSRFLTTTFELGEVVINGISYKDVSLSYDIYADELLTFHPVFSKKISLQPGKVSAFKLADNSYFIYKSENRDFSSHNNGYYELLWDQDFQILAKHRKVIINDPDRDKFLYKFVSKTNYFIEKNEQVYAVKNGKHALKILGIEKRKIRRQLRDNQMNYRQDPSAYLQFLGQYYSFNINENK